MLEAQSLKSVNGAAVTASRIAEINPKATLSFILGMVGLAGWLIPIVGLFLGVAAIAFGTMSLKRVRHNLAFAGMVLGSLVVMLSLLAFASSAKLLPLDAPRSASSNVAGQYAIDSPCYSFDIGVSLKLVPDTENGCTFSASDSATTDEYAVKALYSPVLTPVNLPELSRQDIAEFVRLRPGATVLSESAGSFAGGDSYKFTISYNNLTGHVAYVLHKTSSQNNVFIIAKFSSLDSSLNKLETNWSWK